jgi:hypothetical protein
VVSQFVNSDWDPNVLKGYYQCQQMLKTSSIFIPTIPAEEGPKAFGVANEVQPNMYVVWYKGTAVAPKDGTYRFAGLGDDILVVRINGKTVEDGSIFPVDNNVRDEEKKYPLPPSLHFHELWVGVPVHLKAGQQVAVEILIGEEPGGTSNYFVFVQRDESFYPKLPNGTPLLPVFQLDSTPVYARGDHPDYLTSPEPWQLENDDGLPPN